MTLEKVIQGYAKQVEEYILTEEEAKMPKDTFKKKIWGPFGGTIRVMGNKLIVENYVD